MWRRDAIYDACLGKNRKWIQALTKQSSLVTKASHALPTRGTPQLFDLQPFSSPRKIVRQNPHLGAMGRVEEIVEVELESEQEWQQEQREDLVAAENFFRGCKKKAYGASKRRL